MGSVLSKRLVFARESAGLTQNQLADLSKLKQNLIGHYETGRIKKTPNILVLAKALNVSPEWLAGQIGLDTEIIWLENKNLINTELQSTLTYAPIGGVTVRGHVQAGNWAEAVEWSEEDQYSVPFDYNIFNEYPSEMVYALQVRGDSMDKEYKDGAYLYCVPLHMVGRKLISGEHVIVERQHGDKYEATVKEIQFKHDGSVLLWPRSNNPDHQAALIISDPNIATRSDHTIIRVTALVIGNFYKRPSPTQR